MASTARLRWRRRILFIIHQGGPVCRGRWGSCAQQRDFQGFVVFLLATTGGRTGAVTRCMGSRGRRVVRLPTLLAAALKSLPPGAPPRKSTAHEPARKQLNAAATMTPDEKAKLFVVVAAVRLSLAGNRSTRRCRQHFSRSKKETAGKSSTHRVSSCRWSVNFEILNSCSFYTSSSSVSKSFAPLQYFEPFTRVPLS